MKSIDRGIASLVSVIKTTVTILLAAVVSFSLCSCLDGQSDDYYPQELHDLSPMQPNEPLLQDPFPMQPNDPLLQNLFPMQPNDPFTFEANEGNDHIVGLGVPLYLDSEEDLSEGLEHSACFGWIGSMRVTLTQVTVYDTMDDAGIDSSDPFYRDISRGLNNHTAKFILCDIVLENIDAKPDPTFGRPGFFYIGCFRMAIEQGTSALYPPGERLPVMYFDGTIPDARPDQGYYFTLDKEEAKHLKLGYFIGEEDLYRPCAISVGIHTKPSVLLKYQLRFTITADNIFSSLG